MSEKLPTEILGPAQDAMRKMEGLARFIEDLNRSETMPEHFPTIAKELLLRQRIEVNMQQYDVLDVTPEGLVKVEVVEQNKKTGQHFLLPWDSLKGFKIVQTNPLRS